MQTVLLSLGHADARREIWEARLPNGSGLQKFVILQDAVLGNHFHKKLTETFIIVEGGGESPHPGGKRRRPAHR